MKFIAKKPRFEMKFIVPNSGKPREILKQIDYGFRKDTLQRMRKH